MKKELLKSKTIWSSILVAVLGFFPPVQAFIIANPEIASSAIGALFGILRVENEIKRQQ